MRVTKSALLASALAFAPSVFADETSTVLSNNYVMSISVLKSLDDCQIY